MSIDNNEATREPAAPVSDTAKQVLEDLQKEGFEIEKAPSNVEVKETPAPEPEEKVEEEKEEEPEPQGKEEKAEPEKKPDQSKDKPKIDRKAPAQMPAWKHKVAEDQWQKRESELLTKIADLEAKQSDPSKKEITEKEADEIVDEYKHLEETTGVDSKALKALEQVIIKKLGIDPNAIKEIEVFKKERDETYQNKQFDLEFSSDVESLLKTQHPDITPEGIESVKTQLKKLAFTDEYSKVSLVKIFKAESDSIKVPEVPRRKTAEPARSGASRGEAKIDFDNMTDEAFRSLSPEQTLEYTKHMAQKSGKTWKTR